MMTKKYISTAIVIFGLCLSLCGCSEEKDVPMDESRFFPSNEKIYSSFKTEYKGETREQDLEGSSNYLSVGVFDNDSKCYHDQENDIESGKPFEAFVSLTNGLGKEHNFTLVVLDNSEQVPFSVDGNELESCTFKVDNDKKIHVPFSVNRLEDGIHNIDFVIFCGTYENNAGQDKMYTLESGTRDLVMHCRLNVGNSCYAEQKISYDKPKTYTASNDGVSFNTVQTADYFEIGNRDNEPKRDSVILFQNYKQIDFPGKDTKVYNVELAEYKSVRFLIDDTCRTSDGKQHINQALCMNKEGKDDYSYSFSQRIIR
jgi:hypothetical protein